MTPRMWFHGLMAAFIGGLAGTLSTGIGLAVMYPKQFNLGAELGATLETALVLGALVGAQNAFAYLSKSPIWDSTTERTTTTDAQVHTVEVTTKPAQPGDGKTETSTSVTKGDS